MRAGRKAWWTARLRANRRGSTTRTGRHWPPRSTAGPSPPSMAWSAGASSICANGCGTSSRSTSPSRRSAANCARCAFASCRHARATTPRPQAPSRRSKKLPGPVGKRRAQAGRRCRRHRSLVRRRSPHRPEEQDHTPLGKARQPPVRSLGSAHRLDLYLRRHLSRAGQSRRPRLALVQHRSDEPATRGHLGQGRAWPARGAAARPGRMAHDAEAHRARQHQHHPAAGQVPRAQSAGETSGSSSARTGSPTGSSPATKTSSSKSPNATVGGSPVKAAIVRHGTQRYLSLQ